jgi:hypothetical protein
MFLCAQLSRLDVNHLWNVCTSMLLCVKVLEAKLCLLKPLTMPMHPSGHWPPTWPNATNNKRWQIVEKGVLVGFWAWGEKNVVPMHQMCKKGTFVLFDTIWDHLILNGRNLSFRVWKSPSLTNGYRSGIPCSH